MAALDILRGAPQIWWTIGGGKEPLWPYLVALGTAIWGNIPFTLRLLAAWIGILSVAAVYPLADLLFRPTGRASARGIALLTMLGVAVSAWHLHFSRLGFRAILLPLLSTLGFYFLWRAVLQDRRRQLYPSRLGLIFSPSLLLSAFFVGLAIYAYLAARLLPLVPFLFLILHGLILKIKGGSLFSGAGNSRRLFFLISTFLILIFLFLTPLILYFLFNPADFASRATTVSILNPTVHQGDFFGTAWQTLVVTLGTFTGLTGDSNPLVNLPGQPALPLFLAFFFGVGLLASLYQSLQSDSHRPSPHLFVLCWWLVMLLPALLAPEGAPHHLRLLGTLMPTYLLLAVGVVAATRSLTGLAGYLFRNRPQVRPIAILFPLIFYLLLAVQTYSHYFIHWPARIDFTLPFDRYAVRLAGEIAQAPPGVIYVLPMDVRAGAEARHYTLDYLLADQAAAYVYLPVEERTAETVLSRVAVDFDELRVVRWTADKHQAADEKEVVTYLLETGDRLVGRASFPVYDLESYVLDGPTDFTLPSIDQPLGVIFDGLLRLDAAFVPAAPVVRGHWLPVAVTLAPLAPMETDYKASLRLISPAGERVAQKDRTLRHNFHQGTSLWPPETVNEYYLLPVPPDISAGRYTVTLLLYHPETQTPLVSNGMVEIPLGQIRVK